MTIVEHATGIIEGQTTYRAYIDLLNSDDFVTSIYGNNNEPLSFGTELGFYNDAAATGATAAGINPFFVTFFPSLAADSWLTIGIEAQPAGDEVTISTVEDTEQPYLGCFSATSALSGQDVEINTQTGGAWYVSQWHTKRIGRRQWSSIGFAIHDGWFVQRFVECADFRERHW